MMIIKILTALLVFTIGAMAFAQNSNSSQTGRPRTTSTSTPSRTGESQKATDTQQATTTRQAPQHTETKPKVATAEPGAESVVAAFNALINGIRHADVKAVTGVYLESPRLILFNGNGTVTKGWDQMRRNRESSYPDIKDVKLDIRDLAITMLGRDGAVVTCLWTQSQTFKGTPETATGRMTLVFKHVGNSWKAIHLHTSPDRPDPSRILPSEQTPAANPSPSPSATPTP
jgi:ketosteroid isomerase-like protein